jgi:urate oxidase
MPNLGANRYGKRDVRLVKVTRNAGRSDLKEISANIFLEGDFDDCFKTGDNSRILPTDSMKNSVYALARTHSLDPIEEFGMQLVNHLLTTNPHAQRVRVELAETLWNRILVDGQPHPATFELSATRDGILVASGVNHLVLMKTADSAFEGFIWDRFTTLRETKDRLLGSDIRAEWLYTESKLPYNELWKCAMEAMTAAFANHQSRSVQHTLFEMGQAVLAAAAPIEEVYLCMPNKHCHPVDLSPFSLDNPNEIFVPVDEPAGLIEARITR